MDRVTTEQRSRIMSKVRSKDTRFEVNFRKLLWSRGLRYRLKTNVFGKPDIVFPSTKVAIFLDSCFWHGCPIHFRLPETNKEYWIDKISRNRERDLKVTAFLSSHGWVVVRLWEHDIKKDPECCVDAIVAVMKHQKEVYE